MSEEHTEQTEAAQKLYSSDDLVEARWSVTVLPGESASIHFMVSPKSSQDAITSVSASFTLQENHVVVHNYAGSTTAELISPKDGQGATGDVGVDTTVFSKDPKGDLVAVLAGTVRHGEEVRNFLFTRPFDPFPVAEAAAD